MSLNERQNTMYETFKSVPSWARDQLASVLSLYVPSESIRHWLYEGIDIGEGENTDRQVRMLVFCDDALYRVTLHLYRASTVTKYRYGEISSVTVNVTYIESVLIQTDDFSRALRIQSLSFDVGSEHISAPVTVLDRNQSEQLSAASTFLLSKVQ